MHWNTLHLRLMNSAKKGLQGVAMALVILMGSGCQAIMDSAFDSWDDNNRVDDYRHHGYSERDAKRNAYEDQFFDR